MKDISTSVPRVDNEEKMGGQAKYVSDIQMEGMLYAKTFRSSIVKGIIKELHTPSMPKGYYIVDHRDIPGANVVKIIYEDMPIFVETTVSHYKEPILLIVGPDKEVIQKLINEIQVTYVEKTPVFEFVNSAVHYEFQKGTPKVAFENADQVISYTYETGYQEQAYIEPQGMIGYPEEGKVTLVGSMQCPYYAKNAVIAALNCQENQVRVIQATVGGAFGGKEEFPSLLACQLAVAVEKIKKPIKLIYEREEDMEVTTKRHPSKITLEAALNDKDEIVAIRSKVGLDAGAFIGLSGVVLSRALIASSGAYTFDHLDVSGDVYITNTVPTGAFRGFGAPQMIFAIEMFMNHLAKDLGKDPVELKWQYLAKQGDATSTNGIFRDPVIMPEMIEKAMEVSRYKEKAELYDEKDSCKGIGMSLFFHGCGFTGSGESKHINAKVKLKKDEHDQIYVLIAAVDMGQGAKTTMIKIAAGILDLPMTQVTFDNPDTDQVPDSGPTVASRTTMIVGGLVARAAKKLKDTWVAGKAQEVLEQYEQPSYIRWDEDTFQGDAYPAYSWGVNIVEVEVNPVTYQVKIVRSWSVYDVGKAIDERLVLGQADGGLVQGISYGYLEVMEHHLGKLKQKNMTDYIIPTASDTSPMETYLYDNPYLLGPYGAKGVGELTLVGAAPAVAQAIEQAIKHRVHKIPVTPECIMEMMTDGKH